MLLALMPDWLTADGLIALFGDYALFGVTAVIFAECGLLIGFFFPGDSLLFAIGMLTATGIIVQPIWVSALLLTAAAILGNITGFWIGEKVGPHIFTTGSRFFKPEYVDRTALFFERYGNRAIIFARFVPIVRTVITAMAGVGHMKRDRFIKYSAIGGVIWGTGVTLLGFWLGSISFVRDNLEIALLLIVTVSWIPLIVEGLRMRKDARNA